MTALLTVLRSSPAVRRAAACAGLAIAGAVTGAPGDTRASNSIYPEPLELRALGAPTAVVSLDANEDGLLDLAVNGPEVNRVTVFFGSGTGGFGNEVRLDTTPRAAVDLAAADIDRDGLMDLVWVDGLLGDVVTLYQVPGATGDLFRSAVVPGVESANALETVDRDGDGWIDVVVAVGGSDEIAWYRNEGGTLVAGERLRAGDGPVDVALVRGETGPPVLAVLQDGYLSRDLVTWSLDGSAAEDRWPLEAPLGIQVGDLEDDGVDEIVTTDAVGGVAVLNATATGLVERSSFTVRPNSPWAMPVSISTDGTRILVAETSRGRLSLFRDAGAGFVPRAAWFVSRTVARPLRADVDRDGFRELVLPLPLDDVVLVTDPLVDGLLLPEAFEVGRRPRRVRATPPGDPVPRVVTLTASSDEIWVHRIVDGALDEFQVFPVSREADEIALYDVDGRNGADLLLLDAIEGLSLALADADGRFGPLQIIYPTGDGNDVAVGEFLEAPGPEIAIADDGLGAVRILSETAPGTWTVVTEAAIAQDPFVVRVADLDANGYDDITVLSRDDLMTLVYMEAAGVLTTAAYPVALSPRDADFGNFNGDEFPDIVVTSAGTSTFSIFSSLFRGFYTVSDGDNEAPSGAQNVATADFNGDGVDEIVLGSPSFESLTIHTVLAPQGEVLDTNVQRVRLCDQPNDFVLTAIDDDGVDDLVAIDRESDVVVSLRSDPFSSIPPVVGSLASTLVDGVAQLEVLADARVVDEFAVFRLADGIPVPMRFAAAGRWVGEDPEPAAPDAVYVLRDRLGNELDRATTTSDGLATSVDGSGGAAEILPPRNLPGRVVLRFRTGGNRPPAVRVHDARGRLVGRADAVAAGGGWFESTWVGRDARGRRLARGRYFVHIDGPAATLTTPVTLR